MSFYLGVWNSPTAISDDEAAARYLALSVEKSAKPEFNDQLYSFYCRLTSIYPEVEMVPEDELDSCPWSCGIDVANDYLVMAIQPEHSDKVVPQILALAAQNELVCFDPQAGKVYLPPHMRPAPVDAVTGPAFASRSQPALIELKGEPKTGGGEEGSRTKP